MFLFKNIVFLAEICYSNFGEKMKAYIYVNKLKDKTLPLSIKIKDELFKNNIEWEEIFDDRDYNNVNGDVLFILGGDGTILSMVDFASKNNIPIIGINTGNLGFLTEFENSEIEEAVSMFVTKSYIKDKRILLSVCDNENEYLALNEVLIQRINNQDKMESMLVKIDVKVYGQESDVIMGDGVIISTPTGSTAYSLSSGGAILVPGINALTITPVSAHSLYHRPIVFSADFPCDLTIKGNRSAGLFCDGNFISVISKDQTVSVKKSEKSIFFLRKPSYNYYKKVIEKLKNGSRG